MKMILSFLIVFFSTLSTNIFADYIDIQSPPVIRAGEYRKFSVVYFGNDGTSVDISNKVNFSNSIWPRRANGEFFISPTFRGIQTLANIQASYVTENGTTLTDSLNVSVDSTPLAVDMMGPVSVYRRGSANYFASAVYRDARIDITSQGDWSANFGNINFGGFYRPPIQGDFFSDTITFRFGNITRFFMINFY